MDDPAEVLELVRGTRFGPVRFDVDGRTAVLGDHVVELSIDGPTVLATWESAPVAAADARAALERAAAAAGLVSVTTSSGALLVRSWADACTAGAVAVAVRAALVVGGALDLAEPDPRRSDERVATSAATAAPAAGDALPQAIDDALGMLAGACSPALADALRSLLLGEREQVTLARTQLDELTGAVLGSVTVFSVGTGSGGGATVHAALSPGRAVDVEVQVDGSGTRVEPASEGEEVAAGLALVDEVLAARGRRLARIAAAGDALVVATELLDDRSGAAG